MMVYFFAISWGLDFFFLSEWPFWDKLLTFKSFFFGWGSACFGIGVWELLQLQHAQPSSWLYHAVLVIHRGWSFNPSANSARLRGLEFWLKIYSDKNTIIFNFNPTLEHLTGYLELKLRSQFTGYPSRLAHLHERATKRRIRYQLEFYVSELLTSSVPSPEPVVQTDIIQKILRCPDLTKRQADDGKHHPIVWNSMYVQIFPYCILWCFWW